MSPKIPHLRNCLFAAPNPELSFNHAGLSAPRPREGLRPTNKSQIRRFPCDPERRAQENKESL